MCVCWRILVHISFADKWFLFLKNVAPSPASLIRFKQPCYETDPSSGRYKISFCIQIPFFCFILGPFFRQQILPHLPCAQFLGLLARWTGNSLYMRGDSGSRFHPAFAPGAPTFPRLCGTRKGLWPLLLWVGWRRLKPLGLSSMCIWFLVKNIIWCCPSVLFYKVALASLWRWSKRWGRAGKNREPWLLLFVGWLSRRGV